jgi:hypothetical protein
VVVVGQERLSTVGSDEVGALRITMMSSFKTLPQMIEFYATNADPGQ